MIFYLGLHYFDGEFNSFLAIKLMCSNLFMNSDWVLINIINNIATVDVAILLFQRWFISSILS